MKIFKICLLFSLTFGISHAFAQNKNLTPLPNADDLNRSQEKYEALQNLSKAVELLHENYLDPSMVKPEILLEKALHGMSHGLDPHTRYLSAKQFKELKEETSGNIAGIGVQVDYSNKKIEVVDVTPSSPADNAGIRIGDEIVKVENIKISEETLEEAFQKMRGKVGTTLSLEIITPQEKNQKNPKIKKLSIKRENIKSKSVTAEYLGNGIVYARLSFFQTGSYEELDKTLKLYENNPKQRLTSLILDLRSNPGGIYDEAVRISNIFIESGVLVSTVGRNNSNENVEYANKKFAHPFFPVIVLVNKETASASEIVAGALKDHDRGVIMGETTFGKGIIQTITPLNNGGALKITQAAYLTPKKESIQARGITPDIPLPSQVVLKKELQEAQDLSTKNKNQARREVNMENHLELNELSANQTKPVLSYTGDADEWPGYLKNDLQLQVSYNYLKSISKLYRK